MSLILVLFTGIIGCDDFLDEKPSKTSSLITTTAEQLDALLGNYANFYSEGDRNSIYGTDDYGFVVDLFDARASMYGMAAMQYGCWDTEDVQFDGRIQFWPTEYRKIFTANMVLQNLGNVTGTEELKTILKAEAHLVRAYSYLQLATKYCLPYTESTAGELGLPLKQSTSFEELSTRNRLDETYALIEADIEEALKTDVHLVQDGRVRSWRGNIGAANAFASRYWLGRNDYTEALKYANAALSEYSVLVDYNTEMYYSTRPMTGITINSNTPQQEIVYLKYPYTHDNQTDMTDMMGWKEFYYFRLLNHESWWYIPSEELLDLYGRDTMDLRYRYHMVEGYSYDRTVVNPGYDYPGYVFFFKDRIPSGPTVAEMILTKAECLARNGNVAEAMTTVNQLRAKRMDNTLPASAINLTAANREEAVKKILEERRREMPYSRRWFDIRRFNTNDDAFDDVVITRHFYPFTQSAVLGNDPLKTYTLQKNSRRYAFPIPNTELVSSDGKLLQNTY